MCRRKTTARRTHFVTTSVKYKDLMELKNFLESSNDSSLFINNDINEDKNGKSFINDI